MKKNPVPIRIIDAGSIIGETIPRLLALVEPKSWAVSSLMFSAKLRVSGQPSKLLMISGSLKIATSRGKIITKNKATPLLR